MQNLKEYTKKKKKTHTHYKYKINTQNSITYLYT